MKIISLDFGEKFIGVAFVDTSSILIAQPVEIIPNSSDGSELTKISELVTKLKAELVLLGYPRNLSGHATKQTTKIEGFGDKLKSTLSIPLKYQDETLSTAYVEEQLSEDKKGQKKRVDDQAAALFLQDYIEANFRT